MAAASFRPATSPPEVERLLARAFVATRVGQLAFSALMVHSDRRRVRHPNWQRALLVAAGAESAWLAVRALIAGSTRDRTVLWTDTIFASAGLAACQAVIGQDPAANWMKNLAIGATLGAASPDAPAERVAALTTISAAALWCGRRRSVTAAVTDVINFVGLHSAARVYASAQRRAAAMADEAARVAVARAKESASESERSRQHRLLHSKTVSVLRQLADAVDDSDAVGLARREAARLRHALRAGIERDTDGDQVVDQQEGRALEDALSDIVNDASQAGLSVELVTAELTRGFADTDRLEVLASAVKQALSAAIDCGGARRAVVRATEDEESILLTVRHQGEGFTVGSHSSYEARLVPLVAQLSGVGGTADVWSAPGRGVRISFRVPEAEKSAAARRDQDPDHFPHDRIGRSGAADDDPPGRDGDATRRQRGRLVSRPQDDVGIPRVVKNLDVGAESETLEASPQQWLPSGDPHRGPRIHSVSMTSPESSVVGRSTPFQDDLATPSFSNDEDRRAGRTMIAALLSYRVAGLASGLTAIVAGHQRFRRPRLAAAVWVAAAAESAWLLRRFWRQSAIDADAAATDCAAVVSLTILGRAAIAAPDRTSFLAWVPWGLAGPCVAIQGMATPSFSTPTVGSAGLVGAVAAAALSAEGEELLANATAFAALFVGAHVLAQQIRGWSDRVEQARATAIAEGVTLATEQERSRQLRILHDSALQTLEAVSSGRVPSLDFIRVRVADEAARLQRLVDGDPIAGLAIADAVAQVVDTHREHGLIVELSVDSSDTVPFSVMTALCDACHEALTNAAKHSGTERATVSVASTSDGVRIVISDAGRGFGPGTREGFGIRESIRQRLSEIGGSAEISSTPGEGTRVVLWGPA